MGHAAPHGAHWTARSVDFIVRARLELAACSALVGVIGASVGGIDLLVAFLPFAVALILFAVLNVWEPYGGGRIAPYATYLFVRSGLLALVLTIYALLDAHAALPVVGTCEVLAVAGVGAAFGAWARPAAAYDRRASCRGLSGTWGCPV